MTKTEFKELRKFLRRTNVLSLIAITAQKQCSATHIKQFYSVKVPPHSLLLQLSTNASTYICVWVTTVGQYKGLAPILSHPKRQIGYQIVDSKWPSLITIMWISVPYSWRPPCYSHPYRLLLINKFCIYVKTLQERTYSKAEVTWAEIEEKRIAQYLSDNISVIVISSYLHERKSRYTIRGKVR